jgi:hypothetical protein
MLLLAISVGLYQVLCRIINQLTYTLLNLMRYSYVKLRRRCVIQFHVCTNKETLLAGKVY